MKQTQNSRKVNKGMTMVEVMMGFVILMLLMGMFSGIISFANRMYENAVDMRKSVEAMQKRMYQSHVEEGSESIVTSVVFVPDTSMPGDKSDITLTADVVKVNNQEADFPLYVYKSISKVTE